MRERLRHLLLALLAGASLYGGYDCDQKRQAQPCPGPDCPAPGPPLRPDPRPLRPHPAPQPRPPSPSPRPSPWDSVDQAPVGAAVGPVAPDGTEPQVDLPAEFHLRNKGGRDGSGLCVFTSAEHSGCWHDVEALRGFRDWMTKYPGGGWPEKLAEMIRRKCAEEGRPEPRYIQVEGNDLEVIELSLRTGRFPATTYGISPTGRYGGRRIAHMVNTVCGQGDRWAILDNNYPGPDQLEWMSRDQYQRAYTISGGGWAFILLDAGPPPVPRGSPAWATPARDPLPPLVYGQLGDYRWAPTDDADQVALYSGRYQVGVWRVREQRYYRYLGGERWGPDTPPVAPREQDVRRDREPAVADLPTGVLPDRLHGCRKYLLNGQEVTRRVVIELLEQGRLADDSKHWRVTVIGTEAERAPVMADLSAHPALAPWRDKILAKGYPPGHWALRPGFATGGKPTIYVQSPAGQVLHRQDDYEGGAETMAEALRRADPDYRPDRDPDRRKPEPKPEPPAPGPSLPSLPGPLSELPPWALIIGAGAALLLLLRGGDRNA